MLQITHLLSNFHLLSLKVHSMRSSVLYIHTQQDLDEAKVHVSCSIAPSQVPFQIHIIVFNYASNDIRGGDSWCPLHGHKPTHVLDVLVNVLCISTAIGNVVMCDKVNLEERDDVSPLANFILYCVEPPIKNRPFS